MDEPGNVKDINVGLTSKNLLIDPWTETDNTGADSVTNSSEAITKLGRFWKILKNKSVYS